MNKSKRKLAAVALLLVVAMVSGSALAASNGGPNVQVQQGYNGQQGGNPPQGNPPQNGTPNGNMQQGGAAMLNSDAIEEAIATLSDTVMQEELTALLEAYETALSNLKSSSDQSDSRSAVQDAQDALREALEDAGIDTDSLIAGKPDGTAPEDAPAGKSFAQGGQGTPGQGPQGAPGQGGMQPENDQPKGGQELDVAAIEAAFSDMTDEDAKAELTELLSAYEDALVDLQSAKESGSTDLTSYSDAFEAARSALVQALKAADIDVGIGGDGRGLNQNGQLDTAAIETAIAALTDEATQEELTALLEAYQDAISDEQSAVKDGADEADLTEYRDAVQDARQALLDAMEEAGVTTDFSSAGTGKAQQGRQGQRLDVSAVETAIAGLSDSATQETLTALLETYEEAMAAQQAAIGDNADKDTLDSCREALTAAESALLDALEDAGVDVASMSGVSNAWREQGQQQQQQQKGIQGVWNAVVNWVSSLFSSIFG